PLIYGLGREVLSQGTADWLKSTFVKATETATAFGQNHEVVQLIADAAGLAVREASEARRYRIWYFWRIRTRWRIERFASRLEKALTTLEHTTLLEECRSTHVVRWLIITGQSQDGNRSRL